MTSDGSDSYLSGAIGLALVRRALFRREALQVLDLEFHYLQSLRHKRQQGNFLVALEDEPDVPHPADVGHQEIRDVLVLVGPFARYKVRECVL